jgi:hypothetical protein
LLRRSIGKTRLVIGACVLLYLLTTLTSLAQQKGQYLPGQFGLNAGVMPDPGFTYANISINYYADTLKDANGNTTPATGSYNLWAIENVFFYEPNFKALGGKMVFGVIAPTFANGSLTEENLGVQAGGFGVADIFVQPLTLSWKLNRADLWVGDGFVAPTGRYTPGASDNIGSGYWGNQVMSGTTVYLTKNRGTTANLFTDWEQHGSKDTSTSSANRYSVTPGQTFTMEWGIGQVLPLDKQFRKLLQVGVTGYDQWQVSSNSGLLSSGLPARLVPYYSSHAIGFQTNFILPAKNLNFYFKFLPEYAAAARVQGRTIAFGGSYTFRIPKPKAPTSTDRIPEIPAE